MSQLSETLGTKLKDVVVTIDASQAAGQLADAIKNAAAAAKFNIPAGSEKSASVGAAALDKTAEMVMEVHDKLLAATTTFDDKVRTLSVEMDNLGNEIQTKVATDLMQQISNVQMELAGVEGRVTASLDNVTSRINSIASDGQEASRLARHALNFIS